jgi:hypothetical protein
MKLSYGAANTMCGAYELQRMTAMQQDFGVAEDMRSNGGFTRVEVEAPYTPPVIAEAQSEMAALDSRIAEARAMAAEALRAF